jgi:hypothetical protein
VEPIQGVERPEGVDLADALEFASQIKVNFKREAASRRFMPTGQDYLTVGHLYRGIKDGFVKLADKLGAEQLFDGDPALQVGPELANLPGLSKVTDLASALAALETIVELR